MPKMKTRKSVSKRFRRTASGKFHRARAFRRHLLSGRSRKRKRRLGLPDLVSPADQKRIERMLPIG